MWLVPFVETCLIDKPITNWWLYCELILTQFFGIDRRRSVWENALKEAFLWWFWSSYNSKQWAVSFNVFLLLFLGQCNPLNFCWWREIYCFSSFTESECTKYPVKLNIFILIFNANTEITRNKTGTFKYHIPVHRLLSNKNKRNNTDEKVFEVICPHSFF